MVRYRTDVRTIFIPIDPNGCVWLLKRAGTKKLFPNLITGIGGKVEMKAGEGENIEAAGRREWDEEVPHMSNLIGRVSLRLVTHDTRHDSEGVVTYVLYWFIVMLTDFPTSNVCNEGKLLQLDPNDLPLDEFVPTARHAIPFVLNLGEKDRTIYGGVFDEMHTHLTVPGRSQFY